jgi:hypothetical protein
MLDKGLTSVGADDGVVDIEVRLNGGSVGIFIVNICPVSREDNGGILGQLSIKPLWALKIQQEKPISS